MPLALFFLKIVSAIWGLLRVHKKFRIIFPSSVKNVMGILTGITLSLYIAFGSMDILTILFFQSKNTGYLPTSLYHFQIPSSMFHCFQSTGFSPSWLSLLLVILFFLMCL